MLVTGCLSRMHGLYEPWSTTTFVLTVASSRLTTLSPPLPEIPNHSQNPRRPLQSHRRRNLQYPRRDPVYCNPPKQPRYLPISPILSAFAIYFLLVSLGDIDDSEVIQFPQTTYSPWTFTISYVEFDAVLVNSSPAPQTQRQRGTAN